MQKWYKKGVYSNRNLYHPNYIPFQPSQITFFQKYWTILSIKLNKMLPGFCIIINSLNIIMPFLVRNRVHFSLLLLNICGKLHYKYLQLTNQVGLRHAPGVFIGQGRFSEARAQFLFFLKSSDKLRACVAVLDLRGLQVYNISTMVGAVGKILKIMIARLFKTTILES